MDNIFVVIMRLNTASLLGENLDVLLDDVVDIGVAGLKVGQDRLVGP